MAAPASAVPAPSAAPLHKRVKRALRYRLVRALLSLVQLLPLQAGDVPDTWADIGELQRDVGYTPATPVEVGIRRFVDWYLAYYGPDAPADPKVVNLG